MLDCSIAKWSDCESNWYQSIAKEFKQEVIPHRKQWEEFSFIQTLKEKELISPGNKGLVFGVGKEQTVAYLASRGCYITATDMPINHPHLKFWEPSGQHSSNIESLMKENFPIQKKEFEKQVSFRFIDMNNIPKDLKGYDFCWSLCSFEHLGSAQHGYDFVLNSFNCLRPGGLAFHTTEFDIDYENELYESDTTTFYRRQEIEYLVNRIKEQNHHVELLNYDLGNHLYDYPNKENTPSRQLKMFGAIDHLATAFRLIIKKHD